MWWYLYGQNRTTVNRIYYWYTKVIDIYNCKKKNSFPPKTSISLKIRNKSFANLKPTTIDKNRNCNWITHDVCWECRLPINGWSCVPSNVLSYVSKWKLVLKALEFTQLIGECLISLVATCFVSERGCTVGRQRVGHTASPELRVLESHRSNSVSYTHLTLPTILLV